MQENADYRKTLRVFKRAGSSIERTRGGFTAVKSTANPSPTVNFSGLNFALRPTDRSKDGFSNHARHRQLRRSRKAQPLIPVAPRAPPGAAGASQNPKLARNAPPDDADAAVVVADSALQLSGRAQHALALAGFSDACPAVGDWSLRRQDW